MEEELGRRLADWAAEEAVAERARLRWLEQQAAEDVSLAGVLLDLAERGSTVAVTVAGEAAPRRGRITVVGADFAVLDTPGGDTVLLALTALAALRPEPQTGRRVVGAHRPEADAGAGTDAGTGAGAGAGARQPLTFAHALARLAGDRPAVRLLGPSLNGVLTGAGPDVLTLVLEDDERTTAFVPLAAVHAVCFRTI